MSVSRQRKEVALNQPAAPHFAPQLSERARPHPHNYARLLRTYAAKPCARKGGGGRRSSNGPLPSVCNKPLPSLSYVACLLSSSISGVRCFNPASLRFYSFYMFFFWAFKYYYLTTR